MKSIFSILALTAAFAIAVPAPTFAAAKKKGDAADDSSKKSGEGEKKKDTYPYYGEVSDISATTLTLKKKEGERKLEITKDTVYKNGKEAAKAADVKKGAWVGGSAKKDGDKEVAVSINVGVKQKGDAKEGDKKAEGDKKTTDKKADDKKATDKKADTTKKKKDAS